MNIRELVYFITVIETGNFTDAANICCVTQPTLSAGIKKLEDTLDTQLIIRGTKNTGGVRPTAAGIKILAIAKNICQEADKIKKIAKDAKNPFSGDLRIGAFPTLCPYLMPKILPLFKNNLPDMRFFILEEKTETLINMLYNQQLDIAFLALPYGNFAIDNHSVLFEIVPLFFDNFYLAVTKNHQLSSFESVTTKDFATKELLLLEEGHCLRTQALEFCQIEQKNTKNQTDFRGSSLETLLSMVRMGTGYTLVPQIAINSNNQDIHFIPLHDKTIGRMIYIVFNYQTMAVPLIEKCKEILNI